MAKEVKTRGIYWTDPYIRIKKYKEELDVYQFCVIDGFRYGVLPNGTRYCAGKVENIEKQSEPKPQPITKAPPINEKPLLQLTKGKPMPPKNVTEDMINKVLKFHKEGKSTREIGRLINENHMKVARIIAGQRSLV